MSLCTQNRIDYYGTTTLTMTTIVTKEQITLIMYMPHYSQYIFYVAIPQNCGLKIGDCYRILILV